jgi:hypothetical protein
MATTIMTSTNVNPDCDFALNISSTLLTLLPSIDRASDPNAAPVRWRRAGMSAVPVRSANVPAAQCVE